MIRTLPSKRPRAKFSSLGEIAAAVAYFLFPNVFGLFLVSVSIGITYFPG